ncbi:Long-chain-fatty-acid--CoA ligase (EC [Olavius sp. associated proteobacterium Delta 1]|nr:Long-chain-fatty-acid--CoA ligase (EC [Olavius sp. associated proteobacterium Delta 1]
MQLISELLSSAAKAHPSREAIIFEDSNLTFGDLNDKVNNLANGLQKLGIRRGDRVMVQLANGPEIIMAHYAVIKAGAIAVPLNVMYVAHEIIYIGRDTGAKAIITDGRFYLQLKKDYPELPDLKHIILADDAVVEGCHRLQDFITDSTGQHDPLQTGYDDIVSIIYTSGTTGRPKGATQTHRSILSNVFSLCSFNKLNQDDRLLCALPLFNNFALNVVMMSAFYLGAPLILVDRFEAQKVLEHITEHRATYFAGTPTMYVYLLQAYDPAGHDVTALRVVNSGGAHCPATLIKDMEETFSVIFLDGYGQTEGCGFTTLNPLVGVRKPESVGLPIANVWIKIVDDDLTELAPGEVGEIVEKGDVFSIHGYWNRPEINREVYKKGWFHSGDLGYVDKDGYLYVVDRKQDLIITGGANIYPVEVEEVLYTHSAVALAAVIGVPDDIKGELAKAYIVLKDGMRATEDEIIEFVRSKVAKFKAPRVVEFVNSLPQGPTGKILKRALRTRIKNTNPLAPR